MTELGLSFRGGDSLQLIGGPTYEIDFDRYMIFAAQASICFFMITLPPGTQ